MCTAHISSLMLQQYLRQKSFQGLEQRDLDDGPGAAGTPSKSTSRLAMTNIAKWKDPPCDFHGKIHELCMVSFNSYELINQRVEGKQIFTHSCDLLT